jgi:hypothetical protein
MGFLIGFEVRKLTSETADRVFHSTSLWLNSIIHLFRGRMRVSAYGPKKKSDTHEQILVLPY